MKHIIICLSHIVLLVCFCSTGNETTVIWFVLLIEYRNLKEKYSNHPDRYQTPMVISDTSQSRLSNQPSNNNLTPTPMEALYSTSSIAEGKSDWTLAFCLLNWHGLLTTRKFFDSFRCSSLIACNTDAARLMSPSFVALTLERQAECNCACLIDNWVHV